MKPKISASKKNRHLEFLRLFATVPRESRVEKIRWVAAKLEREENTVRIYLMNTPPRVPTSHALKLLAHEIKAAVA